MLADELNMSKSVCHDIMIQNLYTRKLLLKFVLNLLKLHIMKTHSAPLLLLEMKPEEWREIGSSAHYSRKCLSGLPQ